jgi:hypothetical protein
VSHHVVCSIIGYATPTHEEVFAITSSQLTQEKLQFSYNTVLNVYKAQAKDADNPDVVAKSSDFLAAVRNTLPSAPPATPVPQPQPLTKKKVKDILSAAEFKW